MENPFDLMRAAVSQARQTQQAADDQAANMASMLRGRLRHVNEHHLADLKRELRDFNIHTKKWSKK